MAQFGPELLDPALEVCALVVSNQCSRYKQQLTDQLEVRTALCCELCQPQQCDNYQVDQLAAVMLQCR